MYQNFSKQPFGSPNAFANAPKYQNFGKQPFGSNQRFCKSSQVSKFSQATIRLKPTLLQIIPSIKILASNHSVRTNAFANALAICWKEDCA
jgi:hypothetical protein